MILSDIKTYLRQRGQASLADLAVHFGSEPEAVRGMLEIWIRKGKVAQMRIGGSCGGCTQCDPAANEVYQWKRDGDGQPLVFSGCSTSGPSP